MILGRALLVAAAAMLAAGRGALGFPEARAPQSVASPAKCPQMRDAPATRPPSEEVYQALMP